jgi:hypothetical protein
MTEAAMGEAQAQATALNRQKIATTAWLCFCLLWAIAFTASGQAFLAFNLHNDADSSFFLYGGINIAEGGTLYRDFWDQKPPAIFWQNALLYLLFGKNFSLWALAHGAAFFLFLACYVKLVYHQFGPWLTGLGVIFLSYAFNSQKVLDFGNRTEFGVALFEGFAALLTLHALKHRSSQQLILAAMLSALAFFYKPVGCASLLASSALAIVYGFGSKRVICLKSSWFGFGVGCLLLSLPLFWQGTWLAMIDASIFKPLSFRGASNLSLLEASQALFWRIGPFWFLLLPWLLFPFALYKSNQDRPILWWLLLWFCASACGVILQKHGRPHYDHALIIPMCLGATYIVSLWQESLASSFKTLLFFLWGFCFFLNSHYFIRQQFERLRQLPSYERQGQQHFEKLSHALLQHTLQRPTRFYYWSLGYGPYLAAESSSPALVSPYFLLLGDPGAQMVLRDLDNMSNGSSSPEFLVERHNGQDDRLYTFTEGAGASLGDEAIATYLNWRDSQFKKVELGQIAPYRIYQKQPQLLSSP